MGNDNCIILVLNDVSDSLGCFLGLGYTQVWGWGFEWSEGEMRALLVLWNGFVLVTWNNPCFMEKIIVCRIYDIPCPGEIYSMD